MSTSAVMSAICEHSREELYDLIWSTFAVKLAVDFGISNVAIAKHCKRLNVPRPSRGYWAKVGAGQRPRKVPLPPTADEAFKEAAGRRSPKALPLPRNTEPLLPLAAELVKAITKASLDSHKRTRLKEPALPEVTVSKTLAERVALAFHVLLKELEPLGIHFRKFQGIYDGGYFQRRRDRLYVTIVEDLIRPDGSRGASAWDWPHENARPCGYLTFSFKPDRYYDRDIKQWSESAKVPLEKTLAEVVAGIRKHFLDIQERRERETIENARRHAEWLNQRQELERHETVRLQKEKQRNHAEARAAAVRARKTALLQAADNWQRSNALVEFITACETQRKNQTGELTPEQIGWLAWAGEIAAAISPFSVSYPDPANDGAFDISLILGGGPYPLTRSFE